MIYNLILIQQYKFGLIWSYNLKVMNFLIFRNFIEFFLNLFKPNFDFKRIKNGFYLSRADEVERHHMATRTHHVAAYV